MARLQGQFPRFRGIRGKSELEDSGGRSGAALRASGERAETGNGAAGRTHRKAAVGVRLPSEHIKVKSREPVVDEEPERRHGAAPAAAAAAEPVPEDSAAEAPVDSEEDDSKL